MLLREVTYTAVILRITAALFLGGIIGLERGLKNRPAGLRTYMLVCIGACLIMLTNQYIYQTFGSGDPVRMGAQVVSGIGFLGAGTIIVTRRSQIKGLTTAAGLWAAAAVGLALGIGFYEAAFFGGFVIFIVLTLLHRFDTIMHRNARFIEIYVELSAAISLGEFIGQIRLLNVQISEIQPDYDNSLTDGSRAYIVSIKSRKRFDHNLLLDAIRKLRGIVHLEAL